LPASVSQVHVQPGERVATGARLVTLEAMKMESSVESPLAGTVRAVHVRPSGLVAAGEVMVEIEEAGSGAAATGGPVPLPPRREPGLDALGVLEARLLGFDVTAEDAAAARAALDRDASPLRRRLLALLRAAVVQDQLFKSGPYDDARNEAKESSLDQLAWCVHHRRLDAERLSPRFIRRMQRFFELHGVGDVERDARGAEHALMRLFQARRSPEETNATLLTVLHALARSADDEVEPVPRPADQRVIFEKLANEAVQRHDLQVATAAWNLIYHWYDQPEQREEAAALARQAQALFARVVAAVAPAARAEARAALLALPLAPLIAVLAGPTARGAASLALQLLLDAIYGEGDQDEAPPLLGRLPCRHLWAARGSRVVAVLVAEPEDLAAVVSALPPDAEADLLLGFAPTDELLAQAARLTRPRWTALWSETGEMRARTWIPSQDGSMRAHDLLRDFHPARPVARELARFSSFTLSRLPAPAGLLLLRAVAPGDERLLALAEVERFDPLVQGHFVRVPALEKVFLDALQALRGGLRAATGRPPALNRLALCVRPTVTLSREQLLTLAQRLGPSTSDLGLEKVSLLGRFTLGGTQAAREHAVEWRDPVGLGPRVDVVTPRHRPVAVRTSYELQVLAARRRRLFYPYELVNWLTSREGAGGVERGRFEELDLDDSGTRLESVHGRPWGENRANLVVGLVTNWSARFPDGLTRVLLIGDPTREMGALGEAECRRIVAAVDYAEQSQLPVEWVALSAGARIAFDSGTENLDWTAAVLRRIVEFTARGGVIHVIVDGPCVGAQSYWNAEATMLMHCKGALIMTPRGYMVLTGKRALEVSGSVAAPTNEGIGGVEIMEPNGEAQYTAPDLHAAYEILLRHYDYTYVGAGEHYARRAPSSDPVTRDVTVLPYSGPGGFTRIGEVFDEASNPGRKKPFAIREVLRTVLDQDAPPLERWSRMAGGETAVVLHGQLGGQPVCPSRCRAAASGPSTARPRG
jgi:pyruvate/2-oxoglutarate dehydrogenase complex dihydrolipoamide acyltransferase (E2) component